MLQLQAPPLAKGEIYIGAIGDKNGDFYQLVLLAGDNADASWDDQMAWAKSIGGDLPNRVEQSLLFANLKGEFQSSYYWSGQQHESNSGWAWFQSFLSGGQYGNPKVNALRARAVRRLVIL